MIEILDRWNVWGSFKLDLGLKRDITPNILDAVDIKQVIVLTGPRRTGKSTILYQVMQNLMDNGIRPKQILHVNFEDPSLSINLSVNILDQIYDEYRTFLNPKEKAYLFLDEIQRIEDWERWVRSRNETENIKIFITGSSAQLMSRELATLLTGRHLSFTILPLNFKEFLYFKGIEEPQNLYTYKAKPEIRHALMEYLSFGGYPGIALIDEDLSKNTWRESQKEKPGHDTEFSPSETMHNKDLLKKKILLEYFDDILFKDVALRHQVRDLILLRNLAIHLLTNTSGFINYSRLGNKLLASPDVMQDYCAYLREAYLIDLMPTFSLSIGERTRNDQKVHAVDIGIRNVLSISTSVDFGKNVETVVHNNLKTDLLDNVYYYKDNKCDIDLLVHRNNQITRLVQVMYQGLDDSKILERELQALQLGLKRFPDAKAELIVCNFPINWQAEDIPQNIKITPLWQFLLRA
jgi:predicted AAA+ superfamily ATPase